LDGVRDLAGRDLFPSGSRRNHSAVASRVEFVGLSEMEQLLLCDAQTSGGLLVAIPLSMAARFEAELAGSAYPAVRIGTVTADGPVRVSR